MFDDSVSTVTSSIWTSMNSWFTPTVLFVLLNVMIGTIALTSTLANQKHNHTKQEQQQQQQEQHSQNNPQQQPPKLARSPSVLQRLRSINFYSYRSQEPVSQFKSNSDSDTHYNFDHPHQQQTTTEPQTHYIFEPSHEHRSLETEATQYIFNQTHQQNLQETHTQYDFHQTHQVNTPKPPIQYLFEHTHEQNLENIQPHFEFQPTHEQNQEHKEEEDEDELQSLDEVYSQLTDRHVSRTKSDTKPSSGEAPAKLPAKMRKSATMKSPFRHFEEEDIVESRRPATTREKNTHVDEEVDAKADDFINKFKQQLKLQRIDSILRYKETIGKGTGR